MAVCIEFSRKEEGKIDPFPRDGDPRVNETGHLADGKVSSKHKRTGGKSRHGILDWLPRHTGQGPLPG